MDKDKKSYNIDIDFNKSFSHEFLNTLKGPNPFIKYVSKYISNVSNEIKKISDIQRKSVEIGSEYLNTIKDSLTSLSNLLDDVIKEVNYNIKEGVFQDLKSISDLGWCFLGVNSDEEEIYNNLTLSDMIINGITEEMTQQDKNIHILNIILQEKFQGNLEIIFEGLNNLLDKNDKCKIDIAIEEYQKKHWYNCVNILTQIIDSLTIKQEILCIRNNDLDSIFLKNPKFASSQCWISFYRVYLSYFVPIICKNTLSDSVKTDMRERKIEEILKYCKDNFQSLDVKKIIPMLNLLSCMIVFFDNFSWEEYDIKKPKSINRHWLMHGMYNVDDIQEYDCVKLFLMLYQLVYLYDKLNKGILK